MTLGTHTTPRRPRRQNLDPMDMPLRELFPPAFMAAHTSFEAFGDMLRGSVGAAPSNDMWRSAFQTRAWDDYVRATTAFDGWASMRRAAAANLRHRGR